MIDNYYKESISKRPAYQLQEEVIPKKSKNVQ